jgi:hypothetical protein
MEWQRKKRGGGVLKPALFEVVKQETADPTQGEAVFFVGARGRIWQR